MTRCRNPNSGDVERITAMMPEVVGFIRTGAADGAQHGGICQRRRTLRVACLEGSVSDPKLSFRKVRHRPREQTVRHVHVNEGGQAVIADQFHHHAGGSENGKSVKQCHATGAAGESAALSGPDAGGNGMPIPLP